MSGRICNFLMLDKNRARACALLFGGDVSDEMQIFDFQIQQKRGGPDGMRKVTGGDLGEGRARISGGLTRLHPCHINVSGGGGFNRFAHSAGPGCIY